MQTESLESLQTFEEDLEDLEDLQDECIGQQEKSIKMSNALHKILDSSHKTSKPILSLNKGIEKSLDNHKLEQRAIKILLESRKAEKINVCKIPTIDGNEKTLRKIATRGVVQLFNSIKTTQKPSKKENTDLKVPAWMSNPLQEEKSKNIQESWDAVMEETAPL